MDKKDIDRLWNSIPTNFRNEIKKDFSIISKGAFVSEIAQTEILCKYFGKYNLESVFNVGDKVTIKGQSIVQTISHILIDGKYVLTGKDGAWEANELEIFKGFIVGDNVRNKFNPNLHGVIVPHYFNDNPNNYRVNWFDGDGGWDEEVTENEIIKE